ncbi:MAG: hypothetical protein ACTSPW_02905 [Promethearchaeota archaeon]
MGTTCNIYFHEKDEKPKLMLRKWYDGHPDSIIAKLQMFYLFYYDVIYEDTDANDDLSITSEFFFQFKEEKDPYIDLFLYDDDKWEADFLYYVEITQDEDYNPLWSVTVINKIYSYNSRSNRSTVIGSINSNGKVNFIPKEKWLEKVKQDDGKIEKISINKNNLDNFVRVIMKLVIETLKKEGKGNGSRFMPLVNTLFSLLKK